jgi:IS5 family transposase
VLDAVVEAGNQADATCYLPMLERHAERYGQMPTSVATDGAYASQDNLDGAKAQGIENVVFHKKRGIEIEAMTAKRWLYYKLKRFRGGIEAGISYLKRCFGLGRCNWNRLARQTLPVAASSRTIPGVGAHARLAHPRTGEFAVDESSRVADIGGEAARREWG